MRSSRSAPDPLDPGPSGFTHRGLHSGPGFPENSLAAFEASIELGAGIECDLRLTADNRILVFHDVDARRLCASPLVIGGATLAELGGLRIGGQPIPTLETLLGLVQGRVPLLLEAKVRDDVRRWVPAFRRALAGYGGPLGIMSFDPRLPRLLKTRMPDVRRGLVIRHNLPAFRGKLAMLLADPQFLAVDREAIARPWVAKARRRMPVYAWTIATPRQRAQARVHADALIWEADGRP